MTNDKNILIGKYLSGNASKEEEAEILDWIKENHENEEEFIHLKKFWKTSLSLKIERPADIEKAWQDFRSLTGSVPETAVQNPKYNMLKIAAAIALIACSFIVIKYFVMPGSNSVEIKEKTFVAPVQPKESEKIKLITCVTYDSTKIFYLPDGSRVYLNKHSRFIYPEKFDQNERSTSLSGEAFFEIKHDSVPFVILCKNTKTLVAGTSFDIKGYDNDKKVTVSVVTGTLQFLNTDNDKSEKIILKENEKGTFDNEHSSITKTKLINTKELVWWRKNNLRTKIKRFIKKLKKKSNR